MINQFTQTCSGPRVSYLGNVNVGADVTLGELRRLYDVVSWRSPVCTECTGSICVECRHMVVLAAAAGAAGASPDKQLHCAATDTVGPLPTLAQNN